MTKEIGEWTAKGKTYLEHVKTEKGRGLLSWIADQNRQNGKIKIAQSIENFMELHAVGDAIQPETQVFKDEPPSVGKAEPLPYQEILWDKVDRLDSLQGTIESIDSNITSIKEQVQKIVAFVSEAVLYKNKTIVDPPQDNQQPVAWDE